MKLIELLSQINEAQTLDTSYYGAWIKSPNIIEYVYDHDDYLKLHDLRTIDMYENNWVRIILPKPHNSVLTLDGNIEDIRDTFKLWWQTAIKSSMVAVDGNGDINTHDIQRNYIFPKYKNQLRKDLGLIHVDKSS